jgi:hypothetical protein
MEMLLINRQIIKVLIKTKDVIDEMSAIDKLNGNCYIK